MRRLAGCVRLVIVSLFAHAASCAVEQDHSDARIADSGSSVDGYTASDSLGLVDTSRLDAWDAASPVCHRYNQSCSDRVTCCPGFICKAFITATVCVSAP